MTVSVDRNETLDNVYSATLLGPDIHSSLSFNGHIEKVCKKLVSRIAVLSKIRTYLPFGQSLQYYNAVILLEMSYANVIRFSCDKQLLNRVFKLQKRAARKILYADCLAPSVTLSVI